MYIRWLPVPTNAILSAAHLFSALFKSLAKTEMRNERYQSAKYAPWGKYVKISIKYSKWDATS